MKKILVTKLKHIGDVLLTTPLIHALKEGFPGSDVFALVPRGTEEVLAGNPDLAGILVFDRELAGLGARLRRDGALVQAIRGQRFDLVVEAGGGDREAILGALSGARVRVGYDAGRRGFWGRQRLLTVAVPWDGNQHVVETNLDLARALGLTPGDTRVRLTISPEADLRVEARLRERGVGPMDLLVTVHPVSKWLFKCWRDEAVARVIDHLVFKRGAVVAITGGPVRRELVKVRRILSLATAPVLDFTGQLTLPEVAALLKRSRLFLGVDTAPMHMAAATGTPVVALFGPSGERSWGPWGPGHVVVAKDLFCRPCGRDGCNGSKRSDCLDLITEAEVIAVLDRQLDRIQGAAHRSPSPCPSPPAWGGISANLTPPLIKGG